MYIYMFFLEYCAVNIIVLLRCRRNGRIKGAWPHYSCSISGLLRAQPRERLALSSVISSVPRRAPPATSYTVLNFALVPPLSTIAHAYIEVEWSAERSKVVVCDKDSSVRLC